MQFVVGGGSGGGKAPRQRSKKRKQPSSSIETVPKDKKQRVTNQIYKSKTGLYVAYSAKGYRLNICQDCAAKRKFTVANFENEHKEKNRLCATCAKAVGAHEVRALCELCPEGTKTGAAYVNSAGEKNKLCSACAKKERLWSPQKQSPMEMETRVRTLNENLSNAWSHFQDTEFSQHFVTLKLIRKAVFKVLTLLEEAENLGIKVPWDTVAVPIIETLLKRSYIYRERIRKGNGAGPEKTGGEHHVPRTMTHQFRIALRDFQDSAPAHTDGYDASPAIRRLMVEIAQEVRTNPETNRDYERHTIWNPLSQVHRQTLAWGFRQTGGPIVNSAYFKGLKELKMPSKEDTRCYRVDDGFSTWPITSLSFKKDLDPDEAEVLDSRGSTGKIYCPLVPDPFVVFKVRENIRESNNLSAREEPQSHVFALRSLWLSTWHSKHGPVSYWNRPEPPYTALHPQNPYEEKGLKISYSPCPERTYELPKWLYRMISYNNIIARAKQVRDVSYFTDERYIPLRGPPMKYYESYKTHWPTTKDLLKSELDLAKPTDLSEPWCMPDGTRVNRGDTLEYDFTTISLSDPEVAKDFEKERLEQQRQIRWDWAMYSDGGLRDQLKLGNIDKSTFRKERAILKEERRNAKPVPAEVHFNFGVKSYYRRSEPAGILDSLQASTIKMLCRDKPKYIYICDACVDECISDDESEHVDECISDDESEHRQTRYWKKMYGFSREEIEEREANS